MLTFRQLDDLPQSIQKIMAETEQSIIEDMARRIKSMSGVTNATEWQLARLEAMGASQETVTRELSKALGTTEKELYKLFDEAATRSLKVDDKIYTARGYEPSPLSENGYLQNIISAGYDKTLGEFKNLTRSTITAAGNDFINALDLAHQQIVSGAFDYQTAIKNAIKGLCENGLPTFKQNGRTEYLDSAVRRAVLTGVGQTTAQLQIARMDEMDCNLVETTAHAGARPSHAEWQGEVFWRTTPHPKYRSFAVTGYGTGAGLCGWNCRHSFYPYFEGLSEPAYSRETLNGYNNRTVKYNKSEMSLYDATQQQRYIERQIRRWKREAGAMDAAGLDSGYARMKVEKWQARQRVFIKQTGLRRDYFRERAGKQNYEPIKKSGIITLDKKGRRSFAQMDYDDVKDKRVSNLAAREWYIEHVSRIPEQIDRTKSIEEQARQGQELRNVVRTQARDLMKDQELRRKIDLTDPNISFEQQVKKKIFEKGLSYDEAVIDILKTVTKTNKVVNRNLGLED